MKTNNFKNLPAYPEDAQPGKTAPNKLGLSKIEDDLFDVKKYVVEKIIRVKRMDLPNKGERWKIFEKLPSENEVVVFILEGIKLTKKEKQFLRGLDGVNFLISQAKLGIKSVSGLRKVLKNKLAGLDK